MPLQRSKRLVRDYYEAFDGARDADLRGVLRRYLADDLHWRGVHPFYEQHGVEAVLDAFWAPFTASFARLQRREDIFFGGVNDCDGGASTWVVSMGNFLGLFDRDWLGIPRTGRIALVPYAEFHRVAGDRIVETALFLDIISVMHQAGVYPLPPMTGAPLVYKLPPRGHDGILRAEHDPSEGRKTLALVNRMAADLAELTASGNDHCTPAFLAQTWHDEMLWYGPTGIGSSYTIERYQRQHQYPFRENLADKVFNGHVARVAEGTYCGFFGWPNLHNRNKGGFLGLPSSGVHAPMRIVDIYRREGDKLVENWVFIDLLHYLCEQGLDPLQRMRAIDTRNQDPREEQPN